MIKRGTTFSFDAPEEWRESKDQNRYVFHGQNNEELILSAAVIRGSSDSSELAEILNRLFLNAEQSVKTAASHEALQIIKPFGYCANVSKTECWTLLAETSDAETMFSQAVFKLPKGILLVTFEAPNTDSSKKIFDRVLHSVSVATDAHV